jgi:hypothetical protein
MSDHRHMCNPPPLNGGDHLTAAGAGRRALQLVHNTAYPGSSEPDGSDRSAWFCGRCGTPWDRPQPPMPMLRVCPTCGLGVLLETRADLAPAPGDPFLVVDASLAVEAVSARAERLLAIREQDAIGQPVQRLLVDAGAEAGRNGRDGLIEAVIDAAAWSGGLRTVFVRPRDVFGVRNRALVGACGPPRAALIVLDPQRPALRSV